MQHSPNNFQHNELGRGNKLNKNKSPGIDPGFFI